MTTCRSIDDFSDAVRSFLFAARAATRTMARADHESLRFHLVALLKHPLETNTPAIYMSRLARGSAPPYGEESTAPVVGRVITREIPKADDFYFEGFDKKPAIELCAELLERITLLVDSKPVDPP